jgi:hypothetical protein
MVVTGMLFTNRDLNASGVRRDRTLCVVVNSEVREREEFGDRDGERERDREADR